MRHDTDPVGGGDGIIHDNIPFHNCLRPGHYAPQCPLPRLIGRSFVPLGHTFAQQPGNPSNAILRSWVLLDTCSAVSECSSSSLVKDDQDQAPGDEWETHFNKIKWVRLHYFTFQYISISSRLQTFCLSMILPTQ